jgi:hypothetical protein
MKKVLSILLAVTMVFSLMVGFRAPTAKAATALTTSPDIAAGVTFPQGTATTVTATVTGVPVCQDAYFKVTISGVASGAVTITGFTETAAGVFVQSPHLGTIPAQSSLSQALSITFTNAVSAGNYLMTVAFYDGSNLIASENGVAIVQAPTPPVTTLSAPVITITKTQVSQGVVKLTVSWGSVQGANSYDYAISNVPFGSTITPTVTGFTNTSFDINPAKYGLTYYVAVRAVNGSVTSSWTKSSFTPTCTVVTMGNDIVGNLSTAPTSNTFVYLVDASGRVIDSYLVPAGTTQYTLHTNLAGTYQSPYDNEGLYAVMLGGTLSSATPAVLSGGTFVQDVYIQYKFQYPLTLPSPLQVGMSNVFFSGKFVLATGASGSGTAYIVGPDNKVWGKASLGGGYANITVYQPLVAGTYSLVIGDGYASSLGSDPDPTTGINVGDTLVPSSYSVYYTWTVTQTYNAYQLTVTHVVNPELLFAGKACTAYLYITDANGNPVSTIASGDVTITGVSGFSTWTNIGNGFYSVSGTPASAGTATYTIKSAIDATHFYTGSFSLNFIAQRPDWNPTLTISGLDKYAPGGTLTFTVDYGLGSNYHLNDSSTSISGPGTQNLSNFYIQYGGQIKVDVKANLWYDPTRAFTDLISKPVDVEQVFTLNPTVKGDQVTIDTTKVNVGDTKDITVTVKTASGVERNNGKVVLISTVPGMFTGATNAPYTVSSDGTTVTMDASSTGAGNLNIIGGKYVFSGLKFNHKGYIEVQVWGTDGAVTWKTADFIGNPYSYGIRVYPKVVTLTSDVTKFTAGVAYPVVHISGAVAGLTGWTVYDYLGYTPANGGDVAAPTWTDNGDGTYTFNFTTMHYAFGSLTLYSYDSTGDIQYKITFQVQLPKVTFTSVHKDGLLTDSFAETVKFQVTDPQTGNPIAPASVAFKPQHLVSSPMFDNDDPLLNEKFDPGIVTAKILDAGTFSYDTLSNTVEIKGLKATKGNKYVDYSTNPATLYLDLNVNGVDILFMNALKVVPASLTVTPSDLKLFYNQNNMFSVKALDAHGQPVEGADVYGTNPYQAYSPYLFGGITGHDGVVAFSYTPNYIGEIAIQSQALGLTFNPDPTLNTALIVQIVPAPADTTAPTLTITAPADKSTVNTPTVKVTGTVKDNDGGSGVAFVVVNDVQVTPLPDGTFAATVTLAEGSNTIVVKAFDKAGNVATQTLTVTYQKPAPTGTKIVLKIGSDVMTVNGKVVQLDAAPEIKDGRTFLPLRAIAEAFGAQVTWVPETQGITVVLGNNQIGLQIGNTTAVVNGNVLSIVPPYIKNGRTMVPLRVIAEGFGAQVEWDPVNYIITITMP